MTILYLSSKFLALEILSIDSNRIYNYLTYKVYVISYNLLLYSNYIYSPQTYITTVGMYNNNNELLAVAKLSKPLVKDFTKEALIRVKLDW